MKTRFRHLKSVSTEVKSSSFVKRSYKRGIAIAGTSGLVFGLGVSTSSPAFAESPYPCVANNTAVAVVGDDVASRDAIIDVYNRVADDEATKICLDGDFVISNVIFFNTNFEVYGIGSASISNPEGEVFHSDGEDQEPAYDIAIRNLEIKDSSQAIFAKNVLVADSTFSRNLAGAIHAYGLVNVSNSTFVENTSAGDGAAIKIDGDYGTGLYVTSSTFVENVAGTGGGAISAYSVQVENSTFVDNKATDGVGGAIYGYGVQVLNSTFSGNRADGEMGEGGAIYAFTGGVHFSTFVDNLSVEPEEGLEVPGDSIYKDGGLSFEIGASIFAGVSGYPQLGIGAPSDPVPFTDAGGNVFSTSSETELEILALGQEVTHESTVFGASLTSIFGSSSPALANHTPNTSGTQTFGLAPGSPALDIVPTEILEIFESPDQRLDQRGATRTDPADAGSFEGVVLPASPASPNTASSTPPALAKTGAETPLWVTLVAALSVTFGVAATFWSSRARRHKA